MKDKKPGKYRQNKKFKCVWKDKKKKMIAHRLLDFYVRHGVIVDIVHGIISFRQSKWLEKHINFITQ